MIVCIRDGNRGQGLCRFKQRIVPQPVRCRGQVFWTFDDDVGLPRLGMERTRAKDLASDASDVENAFDGSVGVALPIARIEEIEVVPFTSAAGLHLQCGR